MVDLEMLVKIAVGLVGLALVAYVVYRWSRIKRWAKDWLDAHPGYTKVIVDIETLVANRAAAAVRKANAFKVAVFGIGSDSRRVRVVCDEEFDIDSIEEFTKKARKDPVLAIRG